jgi:NADPH2:quinone reductase
MEAFATAHDALFAQGVLTAGERVLVQGAAGGVGIAAVQLAVSAGAEVVATARASSTHERLASLGATVALPDGIAAYGAFDVILELVGGENFGQDVELLARRGRLLAIGTGGGSRSEIDFTQLMLRHATILGSTLRSRSDDEKAQLVASLGETVLPLLGGLQVPLHAVYGLEQADEAYDCFARGGKLGKIVLTMPADAR